MQKVRSLLGRGFGEQRVRMELDQQRIPRELINDSIASVLDEQGLDWASHAHAVRVRKFGEDVPSDRTVRDKQMRFMMQRGFSAEQARGAFTH